MNLTEMITTPPTVTPWANDYKLPWNQPGFSDRMLQSHLDQTHDLASRRQAIIDRHVDWIHQTVLQGAAGRILDVCCGPGFYTSRFMAKGHQCLGIDFSPASIRYAIDHNEAPAEQCRYVLGDVLETDFGKGYDLAMLIFGEFNTFEPQATQRLLKKMFDALASNGHLLLEFSPFEAIETIGKSEPSWYGTPSGLFLDRPHLCLEKNYWHDEQRTATKQFFIIDAQSADVAVYHSTYRAYTGPELRQLLETCGYREICFHETLSGTPGDDSFGLSVVTAQK